MLISMALAMALQAASPPPQATAVPGGDEIIVQGMRVDRKKVRDFIRAVTEAPYEGQLGRFHAAACPAAMGLPDLQNARIVHRMRQVAAAAGIRVAPGRCKPNIFVIVAGDKRAALDELGRRFPIYFNGMTSREVEALKTSAAPAVAWQVSSWLSSDGLPLEKPLGAQIIIASAGPITRRGSAPSPSPPSFFPWWSSTSRRREG